VKLTVGSLSIPKKYRLPIGIGIALAILGCGYYFLLMPQFERKDTQEAERKKADQELTKLRRLNNDIIKARVEYAELKVKLEDAMRQMPEEKEIPALLRQVSFTASESKTRVKYFAPRGLQPVDFYAELPFDLKYTAPYHNVGYFFDGIRRLERIVHITSFTLESKGQSLDGTCTAKAYVLSGQPAVKETSKLSKKDKKDEPVKK
jgi:type IV pilus assembly protein PilO